jgi:hypothetical protein
LAQRNQLLELVLSNKKVANEFLYSVINSFSNLAEPITLINLALAKGAKFAAIYIDHWYEFPAIGLATLMLENKFDPNKFLKLIAPIPCIKYDNTTKKSTIDTNLTQQRAELIALAVSKGGILDESKLKNNNDIDSQRQNLESLTKEI